VADEDLKPFAAAVDLLEKPHLNFGGWGGGDRRPDGVINMPYYSLSDEGMRVVGAMPVRYGFDWVQWKDTPEALAFARDHSLIAEATADQIVKLSTLLKRQDRFVDGLLASAHESGLLLAMAKRAAALTKAT
jgi:hypothetical protein